MLARNFTPPLQPSISYTANVYLLKVNNRNTTKKYEICSKFTIKTEVFLGKDVLKICSKFTGEHPYRSVISIKLLCNFTKIKLRHGCSPVNLWHIFRTPFPKNTYVGLLLNVLFYHRQNILFASSKLIYGFKVSNNPSRISSAQSICLLHFFSWLLSITL